MAHTISSLHSSLLGAVLSCSMFSGIQVLVLDTPFVRDD